MATLALFWFPEPVGWPCSPEAATRRRSVHADKSGNWFIAFCKLRNIDFK